MKFSDKREVIVSLVTKMQSDAEFNFIQAFTIAYGSVQLAEDIANEIFGNQAGQTQKIFNMLVEYDRRAKS